MQKTTTKQKRSDFSENQRDTRYQNKDWLQSQIEKGLTLTSVAQKCDVAIDTITYWREKFKIPFENPARKKTTEEFRSEVEGEVGNKYTVLGRYEGAHTKIRIRHEKCGYEYKVKPNDFLNGSRCPRCASRKEANPQWKGQDQFEKEVEELVSDEYKVLGQYEGTDQKIRFQHKKCDNEFKMRPSDFLTGERCPRCAIKRRANALRKTQAQFEKEVEELVDNEYSVIGQYENTGTPIKMRHEKCGYEYQVAPIDFLQGNRCPKCGGGLWRNTKLFKQEVEDLVGDKYTVIGSYKGTQEKIEMRHEKCGKKYRVTPHHFLGGHRCPYCLNSRGEAKVQDVLEQENLNYKPQITFKKCQDEHRLPFDFGVKENGNVVALIEFDGKQHYDRDNYLNSLAQTWRKLVQHDHIKDQFALENDIPFLRVNYMDRKNDKVEDHVKNFLKENNILNSM